MFPPKIKHVFYAFVFFLSGHFLNASCVIALNAPKSDEEHIAALRAHLEATTAKLEEAPDRFAPELFSDRFNLALTKSALEYSSPRELLQKLYELRRTSFVDNVSRKYTQQIIFENLPDAIAYDFHDFVSLNSWELNWGTQSMDSYGRVAQKNIDIYLDRCAYRIAEICGEAELADAFVERALRDGNEAEKNQALDFQAKFVKEDTEDPASTWSEP